MSSVLISALVAAVVAAAVSWGKEGLQAHLRRPKLDLDAEFHDAAGKRWFYVRVKNRGETTARTCVAQMSIHPFGVTQVSTSGLVTEDSLVAGGTASLSDVSMCWQRVGNPIELNIHPGQSQRVELAAAIIGRSPTTFLIPSEGAYSQLRLGFDGDGFHCLVRAAADNAEAVERWFAVVLDPMDGPVLNLGPQSGDASFKLEESPFAFLDRKTGRRPAAL